MLKMYSVYDNGTKNYSNPFFTEMREDDIPAVRIFKAQIMDPNNMIAMFTDLYDLYYIGEYDETCAKFNTSYPKYKVITGVDALDELRKERKKINKESEEKDVKLSN